MINVNKQIEYWIFSAKEDLETSELLLEKGRVLHGLFFCHLVIEKTMKALVVQKTGEVAPRTHNLILLAELSTLELAEEQEILLGILMKYQLQGRYPDYSPVLPSKEKVSDYLRQTKELYQWLQKKL